MAGSQGSTQAAPETVTEPEELAVVYGDLYPELQRYAWRLTRNEADAEDLVSQAFANTLAAVKEGKVLVKPRPWLYRCMLNLALDRKRRDLPEPLGEGLEVADHHSIAEAAELNERCADINRAAGDLPDHLRQAFVLAEVRGLHYGEIATEMHRSVSSIRSLLARARTQVRAVAGNVQGLVAPVIGWVHTVARGSGRRGRSLAVRHEQIQSWLGNWPTGGAESLGKSVAAAALVVASLVAAGAGVQSLRDDQSRPGGGTDAGNYAPRGPGDAPVGARPAVGTNGGDAAKNAPEGTSGKGKDGDPSATSPERGQPGGSGPDSAGATQQAGSAAEGSSTGAGGGESPGTHKPKVSGTTFLPAPVAGSSPSTAVAPAPVVPFSAPAPTAPAPADEPVPWIAPPAPAPPVAEAPAPAPSGPIPAPHKPRPSGVKVSPTSPIGKQAAPGSPE